MTDRRIAHWTCDVCGGVHAVDLPDDVVIPPRPSGWASFRLADLEGDVCTSCRVVIEGAVRRCRQAVVVTNGARTT